MTTAWNPEPHNLLTPRAGLSIGIPTRNAACRGMKAPSEEEPCKKGMKNLIKYINLVRSQETEVTSTPTRFVENVVITTKGLQDRKNLLLDERTM